MCALITYICMHVNAAAAGLKLDHRKSGSCHGISGATFTHVPLTQITKTISIYIHTKILT